MKNVLRWVSFALAVALAGCGGGGSSGSPQTYSVLWEQPIYTVTTTPGSTATIQVNANVVPASSGALPPSLAADITPYGSGINPTPGNGPFIMNSANKIPVTFTISVDGSGNYPLGDHLFNATIHVGGVYVLAATTLTVK